jgi:hypothetical protein
MTDAAEQGRKSEWAKVGEVSVDSGNLLLSDPAGLTDVDHVLD